jgi:sec-independent protein translocase protein TatA
MGLSWSHILIALLVFALLFGTGKISGLMGDVAKGIKSFKKGLTEEWEDEVKPEPKVVDYQDFKPPARPKSMRSRKFVQKLGRAAFSESSVWLRSCSTLAGLSCWSSRCGDRRGWAQGPAAADADLRPLCGQA